MRPIGGIEVVPPTMTSAQLEAQLQLPIRRCEDVDIHHDQGRPLQSQLTISNQSQDQNNTPRVNPPAYAVNLCMTPLYVHCIKE